MDAFELEYDFVHKLGVSKSVSCNTFSLQTSDSVGQQKREPACKEAGCQVSRDWSFARLGYWHQRADERHDNPSPR